MKISTLRRSRRALAVAGLLALAAPMPALAQATDPTGPVTPEVMQGKMNEMVQWWQANRAAGLSQEQMGEKAAELLEGIDLATLDLPTIMAGSQLIGLSSAHRDAASARLAELAADPGADGAEAAIARFNFAFQADEATQADVISKVLAHPGLGDAMAQGKAGDLFGMLGFVDESVLSPMKEQVVDLQRFIDIEMEPQAVAGLADYVSLVGKLDVDADTRTAIRTRVLAKMNDTVNGLREKIEAAGPDGMDPQDQRLMDFLAGRVAFLDGAYARGELIDHACPTLTVEWSSDPAIKGMDDLKGKVVVLDFWATWCGPCIRSFPNLRELQQRYAGYEVVVLGVTSLQGQHYPGDGNPPVPTEGDPAKEHGLMKEFMAAKEMTWPVVFTRQEVFNPDFGVQGIPHVAIVDPTGKVRYNGLHPMDPMEEKAGKIDKLLAEAGLPTPAAIEGNETPDGAVGG